MAVKADIVIGSNYGDEGKGLVTDYLVSCKSGKTIVVRHNGGAQAAHTVTTPCRKRHIFKHFGSGTLLGADTFLSRFFVCNPILFSQELKLLQKLVDIPLVYVDQNSPVSTPYDMMINQIIEESRGDKRHGSCGVGFGETVERTENSNYQIFFKDLTDKESLIEKLKKIQTEYVPYRLKALGILNIDENWNHRINSAEILDRYLADADDFLHNVMVAPDNIFKQYDSIVFEGAQGLLLDQDRGDFPHVTRSNTGIKNTVTIAQENGIKELNVTYITRAYNTRHGAGPFPYELPKKPYKDIHDATNVFNEYQKSLRFGWLDIDSFSQRIQEDFSDISCKHIKATYQVAVTCIDQVGSQISYIDDNQKKTTDIESYLSAILNKTKASSLLVSRGPTRNTMEPIFGDIIDSLSHINHGVLGNRYESSKAPYPYQTS